MFCLILKSEIDFVEDSSLKDLGIIGDHESYLVDFVLVFRLVDLDLMQNIRCLEDPLLHGTQYFLNNLPNLRLHLEPFEFLYLILKVLSHRNKINLIMFHSML
jgi:hypothetical protein